MRSTIILLSLVLLASACEVTELANDPALSAGSKVEFYLIQQQEIDSYQTSINEQAAKIQDSILISYEEIISYNPKTFNFEISPEARKRLQYYTPFAVTVDREIIYTGYFWTSLSSRSVDWVVIDLLFADENKLHVQLGYPGLMDGISIPDKRNDPRILEVLRRDNKLIE